METERDNELWKLAKKRVNFKRHLATYFACNLFFWAIWFFTDHKQDDEEAGGVPWPIFPMLGWGVGILFNFIGVYVLNKPDSIQKEFDRLKNNKN